MSLKIDYNCNVKPLLKFKGVSIDKNNNELLYKYQFQSTKEIKSGLHTEIVINEIQYKNIFIKHIENNIYLAYKNTPFHKYH